MFKIWVVQIFLICMHFKQNQSYCRHSHTAHFGHYTISIKRRHFSWHCLLCVKYPQHAVQETAIEIENQNIVWKAAFKNTIWKV